jgi:hypothetical protein
MAGVTVTHAGRYPQAPSLWTVFIRYESILPQRGYQSQPTFLLVRLFLSYQGVGFMNPSPGSTCTRTSKLYTVGGKGRLLCKRR